MPLEVSSAVYAIVPSRVLPVLEFGFTIVVMRAIYNVMFRRMLHQVTVPLVDVQYVCIKKRSKKVKVRW